MRAGCSTPRSVNASHAFYACIRFGRTAGVMLLTLGRGVVRAGRSLEVLVRVRLVPLGLVLPVCAAVMCLTTPAAAQQSEKFENLKVLPPDISKEKLEAIMRGFAGSLGVNCSFCHVGNSPQTMDFASDDKDEKKSARVMIKMADAINRDTLPQLEGMSEDAEVTCYTCHRGNKEPPRQLSDMLAETAASKGVQAAVDQYRTLRESSLEAGLYDFRDRSFIGAARRLRGEQKTEEAVALLQNATSIFPKSSDAAATLGMLLLDKGDKEGARAQLVRALELNPDNRGAKFALDRLDGKAPPAPQR
jgi:tetratricopeptide (TPR) repeat protein